MRRTSRRTARRTSRRVSRRQEALRDEAAPQEEYHDEPAPAPAPPVEADPYAQVKEAKDLLDAGILTEEEFEAEKKKLLG